MKPQVLFDPDTYEPETDEATYAWEDFTMGLSNEPVPVVVTGYFMSWMGPQAGGKVFPSLRRAIQNIIMDDSHPVFSINDEGDLVLVETHHDAPCSGNKYTFKVLTATGIKWYEKNKENCDRRTLCETLFNNSRYSRRPTAKEIGL